MAIMPSNHADILRENDSSYIGSSFGGFQTKSNPNFFSADNSTTKASANNLK